MDQLQAAASTPITIVTLLGGGLLVLAKSLDSSDPRIVWPFAAFCATALVLTIWSAYCLVRSLHGYKYERIPHASQLASYEAGLKSYYEELGTPWLAERAFDDFLTAKYVAATDRNAVNNLNRGRVSLSSESEARLRAVLHRAVRRPGRHPCEGDSGEAPGNPNRQRCEDP